jgi:hypothetical protein
MNCQKNKGGKIMGILDPEVKQYEIEAARVAFNDLGRRFLGS